MIMYFLHDKLGVSLLLNYFFKYLVGKKAKKDVLALIFPFDDKTSHRFFSDCFFPLYLSLTLSSPRSLYFSFSLLTSRICPSSLLSSVFAFVRVFHREYTHAHHFYWVLVNQLDETWFCAYKHPLTKTHNTKQ